MNIVMAVFKGRRLAPAVGPERLTLGCWFIIKSENTSRTRFLGNRALMAPTVVILSAHLHRRRFFGNPGR